MLPGQVARDKPTIFKWLRFSMPLAHMDRPLWGITRRRCPPKERPLSVRDATFVASPRIPPPRTNSRTGQAGDAAAVFLDLEIGQFASKALQHS